MTDTPTPPAEAVEIGETAIRAMRTRAADYIDLRDAVAAALTALAGAGWTLTPPGWAALPAADVEKAAQDIEAAPHSPESATLTAPHWITDIELSAALHAAISETGAPVTVGPPNHKYDGQACYGALYAETWPLNLSRFWNRYRQLKAGDAGGL